MSVNNSRWVWVLVFAGVLALAAVWSFRCVGRWLAASDGLQRCDAIVCLTGQNRLEKGLGLVTEGWSERLVVSVEKEQGFHVRGRMSDVGCRRSEGRARGPMSEVGFRGSERGTESIVKVAGARSTYEEAKLVVPVLKQMGAHSAMIVTDPYHLYRSRWAFEHVAGNPGIRFVMVSTGSSFDAERWWKEKKDRQLVMSEVCKTLFYWVYHGLLGIQKEPEWALKGRSLLALIISKVW